ncbi:MAG: MBL fold metallo-hydrolase [Candidatus Sigynarchaeota archaeon]
MNLKKNRYLLKSMRITFLGTGAAEAFPALYCNCKVCQRARDLGGRNLRCRSSALVNEDLLIDYGPDTSPQCVRFNVDLTKIKDVLITHSHQDHLYMQDVRHRKLDSRQHGKLVMMTVWGNQDSIAMVIEQMRDVLMETFGEKKSFTIKPTREEIIDELSDYLLMQTRVIEPHQALDVGRYKVYTIHAHHKEPELSLNYIIDDGKTRFLYGTDTGVWAKSEWAYIESLGIKMDVVALDCTVGLKPGGGGHHSNESFLATHAEFISRGLLSPGARFFAHHFSHQWNVVYDDIVKIMSPHGIEVTYDGLVIET